MYVIWFPVYFVKTAITSLALFIGFAHFAGNDNYRRISGTASWLIVITSVFAYNSIIELTNFINYSLTFIVIAIITPIMLLVTLRAVTTRQTKNKMPENKQTKSKQPEIKQAENTGRFSWTYISNGLLAVFAILIAIGQWYGKDWPAVGTAAYTRNRGCALGYGRKHLYGGEELHLIDPGFPSNVSNNCTGA